MQDHYAIHEQPVELGGLSILRLHRDESFEAVLSASEKKPVRIAWIYANCVNIARQDPIYVRATECIEFLLNDGAGIEIASHVLKRPVKDNLCGTDWIPELMDRLQTRDLPKKIFLLGGTEENSQRAARNFASRWPDLDLVGAHHGYQSDFTGVLAAITAARPEVLVVGLGVPRQEKFLAENWDQLTAAGIRIAMAGGAIIDHFADAVTRAPAWIQRIRMEWFYRMVTEPRRLWRRYLIGNTQFFMTLARQWWTDKWKT